jgi:hypothetical protein
VAGGCSAVPPVGSGGTGGSGLAPGSGGTGGSGIRVLPTPVCGNDIVEVGEQCEPSLERGTSCSAIDPYFTGGSSRAPAIVRGICPTASAPEAAVTGTPTRAKNVTARICVVKAATRFFRANAEASSAAPTTTRRPGHAATMLRAALELPTPRLLAAMGNSRQARSATVTSSRHSVAIDRNSFKARSAAACSAGRRIPRSAFESMAVGVETASSIGLSKSVTERIWVR